MGEFNSDDRYIYYCRQESLRRNGVAITVHKKSEMQYLDAISKTTQWSLLISKANHSVSQVYALSLWLNNAEEAEAEQFYEDL